MIIYTAIFGNYEELKEPLIITPGWTYMCFTDQDFEYKGVWKIIKTSQAPNPTLEARYVKILGFPEGRSIWCDASFTINTDLNMFWERHFESPMTVSPHPWRKNIADEIIACIKNKRADIIGLKRQMRQYRLLGITDMPVISSGILLRENTEEVRKLCELWFTQLDLSTRDQIGFAFADSKMPGVVKRTKHPIDYRTNQDFIFKTHYCRR